ncbi:hemolysin family protein [Parvularcula lutaonensis]|uniref:Hemolysin family protein n=1 Tax=Parvularcula lutaonensis TaxID=491923 RepID=A0ABV7MB53_9PROT|nr:hemolysin family protein [Parvularcula lutaonensis]GGY46048.1 ion transporter [Parvularcula lutaonensis]
MPDGSEPSQFAAPAALPDDAPKGQTEEPRSSDTDQRGFRLSGLFRRRNGNGNGSTIDPTNGRERDLSASEKAMIERVVALESIRVGDVAIPRADIIAIEVESSISEALITFAEAGHSRLPVYRGDLDDPVGFIHIKDIVAVVAKDLPAEEQPPLDALIRKLLYAPPSMPVADLLLRMQAQRIHMALVIDEFGGTDGLVTIEDLIEEIVGDIRDEHDDAEEMLLQQTPGGRWDCDARVELADLAERLGVDLRLDDEDADTLGGLVFSLAGRVPLRGEVIPHPAGHEFELAEADPRRVHRVLIRLAPGTHSEA